MIYLISHLSLYEYIPEMQHKNQLFMLLLIIKGGHYNAAYLHTFQCEKSSAKSTAKLCMFTYEKLLS
jgi:hypothetical protein